MNSTVLKKGIKIRRSHFSIALACAVMMLNSIAVADNSPTFKDIVYSQIGQHALRLDIYNPTSPPPAGGWPLIISIHGGAWAYANRHNDLILLKLTHHGFALASIDYRLSGEAKFPAQIEDVRHAVQWLQKNAGRYHFNTNKFVATGISAGGHLALLLTLSQSKDDHTIKAVCALYGPTDLTTILPPEMRSQSTNAVAELLGGPVSDKLAEARQASPINYVSKDSPPVLLYHGALDKLVPVSQSIALNDALKKHGAQSKLIIYNNKGHAFGLNDDALRDVEEFYNRALKEH